MQQKIVEGWISVGKIGQTEIKRNFGISGIVETPTFHGLALMQRNYTLLQVSWL